MAQVPYSPVPTVAPSGQAIQAPRVNSPLEAFGGATGAALSRLGATAEKAGDEIFARGIALQNLNNESEAKEADASYMIEAGKLHAVYSALEGKSAVDAFPKYSKDLNELRVKTRDGLSNDMSRKMFDGAALSTMGRTIFNGAGHAASENKKYVGGASVARVAATRDFVAQNPNDDAVLEQGFQTIDAEVRGTQAHLEGWSPERTEQEVIKQKSALVAERVKSMAKTQPWTAKELFDKSRKGMTAQDIERTNSIVETSTRMAGSRIIAQEVDAHFGTQPDGTLTGSLESRLEYAKGKAEKLAPDDPLMTHYVTQAVTANFNQVKAVKRDLDIDNINTVNGALMGGKGGKVPTTVDELTADPKVRDAWDALDQTKQRSFMSALTKNARGDVAWTRENQSRVLQLKGLAQSDPREFMGVDVGNENIPWSAKQSLFSQQLKLKDKAEGDPRVTHALQVLRPMIQAAGLDQTKDKDQYYQFVGSLQDAMDSFQQQNKKLPKADEINTIGAQLLQQTHSDKFLLPWSKDFMFAMPVPDGAATRIKNDPFWAERNIVPTDADVQRIWTREQYQKLYGGAKSSGKPKLPQ